MIFKRTVLSVFACAAYSHLTKVLGLASLHIKDGRKDKKSAQFVILLNKLLIVKVTNATHPETELIILKSTNKSNDQTYSPIYNGG